MPALDAQPGRDAACGWRLGRHDPWLKRVESLAPFHGFHRFLPTLLCQAGYRVIEVEVKHRPRRYGVSHYGVCWMEARRLRVEAVEGTPPSGSERP